MGAVRGLRVLVPLLLNPYAPVTVERVDIKVDLKFEANYGEIKEIKLAGRRARPRPAQHRLRSGCSTWDNKDIFEDVPVDVPASLAGSIVSLEVTSGDSAKLDAAPPVDLPSLLAAFRKLLPGNVWAVTLYPADEGVAIEGKLVRDLPASAARQAPSAVPHPARAGLQADRAHRRACQARHQRLLHDARPRPRSVSYAPLARCPSCQVPFLPGDRFVKLKLPLALAALGALALPARCRRHRDLDRRDLPAVRCR